jgi:NAD(P)-dependent dehydrogenase (short-subunit alcohol dehydrogenase family)
MTSFAGRTAIVTGAAQGIGAAIAVRLAVTRREDVPPGTGCP